MRIITVAGGDLYRIALEQFGDATAWVAIARANGLSDPALQGVVRLVIPASKTGGVVGPA